MTGTVTVIYANQQPPDTWDASLFLAGPMPRTTDIPSWRPEALKAIEAAWTGTGELVVFVPEPHDGIPLKYDHHTWEDRWLAIVDVIVFWVPRDMRHLPGLTTNVEFGRWEASGRVVLGAPTTAAHVGYLRECATRNAIPVTSTLDAAAAAAVAIIGDGARRNAKERQIPLQVWRHPEFQEWLTERRQAGDILADARVLWCEYDGNHVPVRWVMRVQIKGHYQTTTSGETLAFGDLGNARSGPVHKPVAHHAGSS
ncbi:nucleoside 2-deoxyribosyltransferase domain-containing protein [Polymorphospora sp. NPDC050346]|uniref:nucleoside 2-deoxyribosyltransferase domain-containing protein n=1 Tax=Polymorphospora sp. NPDC050346 TaxID=3155780 RepID=UPI0033F604E6